MRRASGAGSASVGLTLVAVSVLIVAGCSDIATDPRRSASDSATESTSGADLRGSITVSGATSLTGAFTRIAGDFEAAHPGVEVALNFGASSALATQILGGVPADVYASADELSMAELTDESLIVGQPEIFATNELVIVTKPGNPQGIERLADLADAGVVALCGEHVPCGRYAAEALARSGVVIEESAVTRAENVGATLTAVAEGDAVAAVVYVTDATSAGDAVEVVAIPSERNVVAAYPIAVLRSSHNTEVAEAFMAHVLSDEGQAVLAEHGFLPPT